MHALRLPLLALVLSSSAALAAAPPATAPAKARTIAAGLDRTVAPGDDFNAYANGGWLKATPIPPDKASYGVFAMVADQARERTIALIQEAADAGVGDADARKVGDFYASFMDEAGIEAKGVTPLKPQLAAIAAIADRKALSKALGATLRADVDPLNMTNFETPNLFGLFVAQGFDDPTRNVPYLLQGGLGLPDRDYYVSASPKMVELRTKYQAHLVAMFTLAGLSAPDQRAARVFALETKMATLHATRLESSDVLRANNPWKREELATRAPGLDWPAFLAAAGLKDQARFIVWHPRAVSGLSALVASEPLDTWRDWLAAHAIEQAAPVLPKAFVDERFAFFGKAMSGTPQQRERWKRGVDLTSWALGEVVGRLYAQRHFPPEAKAKAQAMVNDLVKAFGARVDKLTWMSDQTRAKAKEKLATLRVGVGYPDTWRDYSALKVVKGDAFGNAQRAELFDYQYALSKLGKPVDRGEWWLTPQTVNALNLPLQNALNFPAAILQPPYFDLAADAAQNYGAIGAIIGHEISHSFDDQGAQFDAQGRLADWWTDEDRAHFKAAGEQLAAQYDAYRPFPDLALNGRQTLGENIADVAGLATAYDAWVLSTGGTPGPTREGFTAEQIFFLSYAQSWRSAVREPALRQQIVTDGHAPAQYRVLTVRNLDPWYAAFSVKPTHRLALAPKDRVRVW